MKATIDTLQVKLDELQKEIVLKEQRLSAVNGRLRSQLDVASKENAMLKEKLTFWEEKALDLEKQANKKKSKKNSNIWKAINEIADSVYDTSAQESFDANSSPRSATNTPSLNTSKGNSKLIDSYGDAVGDDLVTVQANDKENFDISDNHNNSTEVTFQNGTRKIISNNTGTSTILFPNGDVKENLPDGTVTYLYTESGTKHTTLPDGVQIIEFVNKQVERHFTDGSRHVTFPDGSSKLLRLDGTEETRLKNGTLMKTKASGEKIIEFTNGQREYHTSDYKRREYPDGTSKTVYADGRQETKYASGRYRVKDGRGVVIIDRMLPRT